MYLVPLSQNKTSYKNIYINMSLICVKNNLWVEHIFKLIVLQKDSASGNRQLEVAY